MKEIELYDQLEVGLDENLEEQLDIDPLLVIPLWGPIYDELRIQLWVSLYDNLKAELCNRQR